MSGGGSAIDSDRTIVNDSTIDTDSKRVPMKIR